MEVAMTARRFLPTLFLGVLLGAAGSAGADALRPMEAASLYAADARADVSRLVGLAQRVPDPTLRDRMLGSLGRVDARLTDIQRLEASLPDRPTRPPPAPTVYVTSDAELASILGAVKREPFSDDKLAVLRSATYGRWFTVAQVGVFVDAMTFSSEKVDAAAMLFPQVVDPQSWYLIYGYLTFSSDKDDLRRRTGV
jgi:hypothetical protein